VPTTQITQVDGQPAVPWKLDRGPRSREMGYLPGLDGIRAIAVIGVLLYHADLPFMPGGFLGVDVFFVLSGFLITSLILEEIDRSGRVDFGKFYLGRARRLLPALLLVLLVTSIAAAFVYRDAARQVAADVLASVFYVNNWWYIVADQSYFEFIGRPPLLKHLWSLAIEEQFYLVWPLVVLAAAAVGRSAARTRLIVGGTAAVGAGVSIWAMVRLYDGTDPSRAYYGTDARMHTILIGCLLAVVVVHWRPRGRLTAGVLQAVGALSLVGRGDYDLAIAIDNGPIGDYPGVDPREMPVTLGGGPAIVYKDGWTHYDRRVIDRLLAVAQANDIPVQPTLFPGFGSDGAALIRSGLPTALLGIATRYTHAAFEMGDERDVEGALALLRAFVTTPGDALPLGPS